MAEIIDPLIFAVCGLLALVLLRYLWLRNERRKLAKMPSAHYAERFDRELDDDEKDKDYSGRVIKRLRARVIEGRVELTWEYHPSFIHRGFVLTGKGRYGDGDWQPLVFEPFEDSGSWNEGFKYGETRSYLFIVKKQYFFFFGLFGEEPTEIVYDQISVPVRKGRYHKEIAEHLRDRKDVMSELAGYKLAEREAKRVMGFIRDEKPPVPIPETQVDKLKKRLHTNTELEDYLEQRTAEINGHPSWSEDRKRQEIKRMHEAKNEMGLED